MYKRWPKKKKVELCLDKVAFRAGRGRTLVNARRIAILAFHEQPARRAVALHHAVKRFHRAAPGGGN
jgi:hypothetical protein